MREFETFLVALFFLVGAAASSFAQTSAVSSAHGSYTLVGGLADGGTGGNVLTISGDIGTAAANRVVVVAVAAQNPGAFTGVTVNGVACSNLGPSDGADIWYVAGASPGSGTQSIAVTGHDFETRGVTAWALSNLSSTTPTSAKGVGTAILSGGAVAGDLVFASNNSQTGADTFNASTVTPTDNYNRVVPGGAGIMADWLIASGASPFSATNSSGWDMIVAKWH